MAAIASPRTMGEFCTQWNNLWETHVHPVGTGETLLEGLAPADLTLQWQKALAGFVLASSGTNKPRCWGCCTTRKQLSPEMQELSSKIMDLTSQCLRYEAHRTLLIQNAPTDKGLHASASKGSPLQIMQTQMMFLAMCCI